VTVAVDSLKTLYVAFESGVFRSTDGGQTLSPMSNGLRQPCYDRAVFAIAPSRPSTIYLARCGLFRSDDSGANWRQLPVFETIFSLAVHPQNPSRILAGTFTISISDDAGETWRPASFEHGDLVLDLVFDPSNPARMVTALWGSYRVGRSEDGGESWSRSSDGYFGYGASAVAFDAAQPGTVYVTTHGIGGLPPELPYFGPYPTGVNRSTDGGLSWQSLEGSPDSTDVLETSTTGELYAVSWGTPGIFVFQARPERSPILRPAPRSPSPRPVERPPRSAVTAQ